jgi:hypothetical protein
MGMEASRRVSIGVSACATLRTARAQRNKATRAVPPVGARALPAATPPKTGGDACSLARRGSPPPAANSQAGGFREAASFHGRRRRLAAHANSTESESLRFAPQVAISETTPSTTPHSQTSQGQLGELPESCPYQFISLNRRAASCAFSTELKAEMRK